MIDDDTALPPAKEHMKNRTNFCIFLWSENFRLCRRFFCVICALLCIFVWFGACHGSHMVFFKTLLRNLSAICVFFDISSEHYRLKRFFRGRNEYQFSL